MLSFRLKASLFLPWRASDRFSSAVLKFGLNRLREVTKPKTPAQSKSLAAARSPPLFDLVNGLQKPASLILTGD